MSHSIDEASENISESSKSLLRGQLRITPDPRANCVLTEETKNANEVTHNFKANTANVNKSSHNGEHSFECGDCQAVITETDSQSCKYVKSEANTDCICPVFDDYDCVLDVQKVESGSIIAVVTIPNRDELRQLMKELKGVGASVSVDWLVNSGKNDSTIEIDVNSITTKQQEALETALQEGYYETPREINLGDLAEKLGISESAVSQRLNAAETKLVKSFLDK